ncbi:hypothetical protein QVD17_08500 [Tagetes erecta]|uniref:PPM-type phosphatase domain-containing protein n=1 Tax=Tagetes erecta TaxID=13708 RepID=A0AAD8L2G1_TARER|nr:hypothetical protein QVD17_08500 [Tagetes erecta]
MDHTISSSTSFSNCRQIASCSGKLDVTLARRRRAELRRLKVLSNGDDCLLKRRRFENVANGNQELDFPHHSSVIGRRREMEDAVTIKLGFVNANSKKFDFYAVYDGHSGSRVAYDCRERLHKLLAVEMETETENGNMNWEKMMVN